MKENNKYELIKFKDGEFELDVNVSPEEDNVWLTLEEIGKLLTVIQALLANTIKKLV